MHLDAAERDVIGSHIRAGATEDLLALVSFLVHLAQTFQNNRSYESLTATRATLDKTKRGSQSFSNSILLRLIKLSLNCFLHLTLEPHNLLIHVNTWKVITAKLVYFALERLVFDIKT